MYGGSIDRAGAVQTYEEDVCCQIAGGEGNTVMKVRRRGAKLARGNLIKRGVPHENKLQLEYARWF